MYRTAPRNRQILTPPDRRAFLSGRFVRLHGGAGSVRLSGKEPGCMFRKQEFTAGCDPAEESGKRNPGKVPLLGALLPGIVSGVGIQCAVWLPGAHGGSVSLTGIVSSALGRLLRSGRCGSIHAASGAGWHRRRVSRTGRSG